MKTRSLLIVRHAKSSWDDLSQKDFDRPLNDRGKKDAPAMAKRIHKEEIRVAPMLSFQALQKELLQRQNFLRRNSILKRRI